MSHWMRATANAVIHVDGRPFVVRQGQAYGSDEPVVRLHPDLFTSAPAPVEQVTRAPGERANVRRSK